jgi:hypothetical protein
MERTQRLTFALFGLTALVAVAAFWAQLPGLVGAQGIAPATQTLEALARAGVGWAQVPTLLWLWPSDGTLHLLCAGGVLASLCITLQRGTRAALLVLWACWLSLGAVSSPFLDFQWDVLLLEGALVLLPFAGRAPGAASRLLPGALAALVTFESAVVKLSSGDPAWRDLTALTFHWWTQPLPSWSSLVLWQLPLPLQRLGCGVTLAVELICPLLVFGPRRARLWGAAWLIGLQLALLGSGNFAFYNWLTLALAVPLLDDGVLGVGPARELSSPRWAWALTLGVIALAGAAFFHPRWLAPLRPFRTLNGYGAFAVMTKQRVEIVFEGSDDGLDWVPYELPYKPGRVDRALAFVAPWQPRLDWQLWFAALGTCDQSPWALTTQQRLLEGSPAVRALFAEGPVAPPRYLRTVAYDYRFAPPHAHDVWARSSPRAWCPPVTLAPDGRLVRAPRP